MGEAEGVGHGASNDESVSLTHEAVENLDLVGNLGAPHDHDERTGWILKLVDEILELLFDEETHRAGAEIFGHASGGGVGAVGRAEGVIDVEVAERSELLGEVGVIGLFTWVKTHVFEKEDFPVLHCGDGGLGFLTDAVFDEVNGSIDQLAETDRDGFERVFRIRRGLGAPEVGHEDDLRPGLDEVFDRRDGRGDAGVVGDLELVVERHVEIDAHEDAFAGG